MYFEITGQITDIEIIAVGSSIRDIARLRKQCGRGRWQSLKESRQFASLTIGYAWLKSIGTKHTVSEERN